MLLIASVVLSAYYCPSSSFQCNNCWIHHGVPVAPSLCHYKSPTLTPAALPLNFRYHHRYKTESARRIHTITSPQAPRLCHCNLAPPSLATPFLTPPLAAPSLNCRRHYRICYNSCNKTTPQHHPTYAPCSCITRVTKPRRNTTQRMPRAAVPTQLVSSSLPCIYLLPNLPFNS